MSDDTEELRAIWREAVKLTREAQAKHKEAICSYQDFVRILREIIDEAMEAIEAGQPKKAAKFLRAAQGAWGGKRTLN